SKLLRRASAGAFYAKLRALERYRFSPSPAKRSICWRFPHIEAPPYDIGPEEHVGPPATFARLARLVHDGRPARACRKHPLGLRIQQAPTPPQPPRQLSRKRNSNGSGNGRGDSN